MANPIRKVMHRVDFAQQRTPFIAFPYAVMKKFGDDQAGMLAALIAYYGFLSLFPLLLVLFTVLGLVAGNDPSIQHKVTHSALAEFPIIGNQLGSNIHSLNKSGPFALIVGLAGLLWGAQGVSQAGQYAMAEVWNVPMTERPSFFARLGRTMLLFGVMGFFLLVSTALAGFSTFGAHTSSLGLPVKIGAGVVSVVVNIVMFLLAFRILTPKQIAFREFRAGAVIGGIVWTIFQAAGGYLVGHQLKTSSQVYGFFGIVLGLLWLIFMTAQITLYAAEVNVVKYRRLWPRGLVQPPLTEADKRTMAALAQKETRIPEQDVDVDFETEEAQSRAGDGDRAGARRGR
ncbi:MAG TPA: YihY/virulence factor BrkB family protein [Acidimicrobiales bacterium]|nr:YihY/virulence factor BrkB family protein [Acidimicrobiales bacterium]